MEKNAEYRYQMRRLDAADRSMQKVINDCSAKAVEQERTGNHGQAVQLAARVAKLKKQREMNKNIRNSVETARVYGETGNAMKEMMGLAGEMTRKMTDGLDPTEMIQLQADYEMTQESLKTLAEQSNELFEPLDPDENVTNEAGEKALKELLQEGEREIGKRQQMMDAMEKKLAERFDNI